MERMSESRDGAPEDSTHEDTQQDDTERDEAAGQTADAASDDPYDIESDFGPDGNTLNSAE